VTLEDLVREVFPDLIERDNGEIYCNCPFCEERGETRDSRNRLGINYEIGTWQCFNCRHSGRDNPEWLFRELVRIFELDPQEYRFSWRSTLEQETVHKKKELHPVSLPKEFEPLWEKSKDRVHRKALKYLLKRGVTEQQIEDHFIGFCAVGKYINRIVFPVYRKEHTIGFVTRTFDKDEKQRYLNSEGLKYIWNCPDHKKKRGILIEGIFDALAGERILPKYHLMAGLGSDLTEVQLEPLLKFKELTFVPDPDRPGILGTIKRMRHMAEFEEHPKLYVVVPKEGITYDWGKLGESRHGSRKIIHSLEDRVPWNKFVATRLKARAAFM